MTYFNWGGECRAQLRRKVEDLRARLDDALAQIADLREANAALRGEIAAYTAQQFATVSTPAPQQRISVSSDDDPFWDEGVAAQYRASMKIDPIKTLIEHGTGTPLNG